MGKVFNFTKSIEYINTKTKLLKISLNSIKNRYLNQFPNFTLIKKRNTTKCFLKIEFQFHLYL